ncbi:MAG: DUF2460 domain-containing protein [Pseudomonadota bacterium]
MSNFHEDLFPLDISLGVEGGPTRRTDIVAMVSGHEERNSPWANSRRSYNAGYGIKSLTDIQKLIAFFEARHGRLYGFRFRDPFDHHSNPSGTAPTKDDQIIGTGDGTTQTFQLAKTYASGPASYKRIVTKPVAGSVIAALNGTETSAFSTDTGNGTVTFTTAPTSGVLITAGFVFDTPVRFDTDSLRINLAAFEAGDIPSVPLIEVLI